MEVREATSDDADAIRSVARSSMQASYSLSPQAIRGAVKSWYGDEALAEKLDDDDLVVRVADIENEGIVAFSESALLDDSGDILWLHVDPMFRGEGLGADLFQATREALAEKGVEELRGRVLADNAEGNEFYEHYGLHKVSEDTVEIDGEEYVENIYSERDPEEPRTLTHEGEELYVSTTDSDRGSKGPFYTVYTDADGENKYGFFCGNCESLVTSMDSMGRMECESCGNVRKPTRWDAAHM
ncbi:GNAT family N-acetyltransferase [Halorarius halobius]|uniref:GNAT family N-acetyltransferase n=1 Tax=Halorarius halobius TaxID=2962671 RepID=UPI0020CC9203|nr:GNAT family N-acetyltransferase [Halorarius halobius]